MSKSHITPVQNFEASIHKLQILSQELQNQNSHATDNALYYLNQTAIQNFILSFQKLKETEGTEEKKGEEVDSRIQTKQILSQIELDFLNHLKKQKGFDEQENTRLSNQDIINRHEVHKDKLDLLRREVKDQIEEYSKNIPTKAPYQNHMAKGEIAFPPTFKAQEIYQYSSEGIKNITKDLIEESKADLEAIGISLDKNIKYVISCFGSLAKNEASPYSDLEFGVLLEDNLSEEKLIEAKEYFSNLTDLLNIKVINLGETTATIQNIQEVKDLALAIPIKNGVSFDGNALGGCKTPVGNKRAIVKKIEEINQDQAKDIALIHSNNALSQTQKNENIAKISENIHQRISKLKEDEYELIMTPSQMAQFHNEEWYQKDRHLSTTLYTTNMLQASSLEDGKKLLESYQNEMNNILNKELEIDELDEEEQEQQAIQLSQISIEDNIQPMTLRTRRAFNLLNESIGKFEPKAGRNQEQGKSFSPKYDFYRPATMLIDHLSYLYDIGNKDGEKSVWDRFDALFINNSQKPTPLPLATADNPNIEGISNLKWMIDRTLQIRLKNYISKDNQNEDMILLDEYEEKERQELEQKGLGIYEREIFEVYYVMMSFYDNVNRFNESRGKNIKEFSKELYCDNSFFRKAVINSLFLHYEKSIKCHEQFIEEYKINGQERHPNVAESLNNLGNVYRSLGDHQKQIALFNQSLEINKEVFGEKHPNVAASLNNLGSAYGSLGDHQKQIALLNQSLAIRKAVFGEKHPDIARSLINLGYAYGSLGDHPRALELCHQSLEINKKNLGEKHPIVAGSLNNLGFSYESLGDHQRAIELYHQSLEINKVVFGEKHPDVAASLNNLGSAYGAVGDYKRAIELHNQSLEINKEVFGEKHPNVARSLNNLGSVYGSLGDYKRKIALLNQSLEINKEALGEKHPLVAASLNNLGSAYGSLGDHKRQIELYHQSLEINKAVLGEKHPSVAAGLNNLGSAYGSLGDHQKAIELYHQSLEKNQAIFGKKHQDVATSLNNLGTSYGARGDHKKQIELYHQSLEILKEVLGEKHPSVAAGLNNLGSAYGELGNHKRKIELLNQSLEINKAVLGEKHPNVATSLNNLGNSYGALSDHKKEIELLNQSLAIRKEVLGEKHPSVAENLNNLGCAYEKLGNHQKAIELLNQSLEINKEVLGERHPSVAENMNNLGNAHGSLGEHKKQIDLLNQSLEINKEVFGERHPKVATGLNNLGSAYGELGDHKKQIELLNQSLKINQEIFGEKHPAIAASLNNLGSAYGALGDHKNELKLLNQSLKIKIKAFGERHPNVAASLTNLGLAYGSLENHKKRIALLHQSLEINKEALGKKHPDVALNLNNLGNAYKSLGDFKRSLIFFKDSAEIFTANSYSKNHPKVQLVERNYLSAQKLLEQSKILEKAVKYHATTLQEKDLTHSPNCLEAAEHFFLLAISKEESSLNLTLYSNFLYQQQRYDEAVPFLIKAIRPNYSEMFSYDENNKIILPQELQNLMNESFKKDELIEVKPQHIAIFLATKIHQKEGDITQIQSLLNRFQNLLTKDKISGNSLEMGQKIYDICFNTPSTSISATNTQTIIQLDKATNQNVK